MIDYDFGFGCGFFVNTGRSNELPQWKNWRSFFLHLDGFFKVKVHEHYYLKKVNFIAEEGKINIKQIKIFKGENL